MLNYIKLTLAFIIVLNLGAFLNEKSQEKVAQQFDYKSEYHSLLRFYMFSNEVYNEVILSETATELEIKEAQRTDLKYRRYIDLIQKFYLYLFSLLFLFLFKKLKTDLLLVPAFLFMHDFVHNAFYTLFEFYTCSEFNHWGTFSEAKTFISPSAILGFFFLLFVLSKIPKAKRALFITSGIIGGYIGAYIWMFYFAEFSLS